MDGLARTLIQAWSFLVQFLLGLAFAVELLVISFPQRLSLDDYPALRSLPDFSSALAATMLGAAGLLLLMAICQAAFFLLVVARRAVERIGPKTPIRLGRSHRELAELYLSQNREALVSYHRLYSMAFLGSKSVPFANKLAEEFRKHVETVPVAALVEPSYFLRIVTQDQVRGSKIVDEGRAMAFLAVIVSLAPLVLQRVLTTSPWAWPVCILLTLMLLAATESRRRLYASLLAFGYLETFTPGEGASVADRAGE